MGNILEEIKEGIAWDLGFRKYIKRSARFWSNNNLFAAWPQAVKPYVK